MLAGRFKKANVESDNKHVIREDKGELEINMGRVWKPGADVCGFKDFLDVYHQKSYAGATWKETL